MVIRLENRRCMQKCHSSQLPPFFLLPGKLAYAGDQTGLRASSTRLQENLPIHEIVHGRARSNRGLLANRKHADTTTTGGVWVVKSVLWYGPTLPRKHFSESSSGHLECPRR